MIEGLRLDAAQEQCLRDQVIADDQPGTILRDFQMLLDFVGSRGGVEATGKYNLLPIKFLAELDQRLSRPLNLKLKRPLLRSHPYLQGLNLVLRASGLARVEGAGEKARLVLDPAMLMQWEQLNPTERYFNLLEAWLRFGSGKMVGEQYARPWDQMSNCMNAWHWSRSDRVRVHRDGDRSPYEFGVDAYYQLALMDLFGLLEVAHPKKSAPATWHPESAGKAPFGDALLSLLFTGRHRGLLGGGPGDAEDDDGDQDEDGEWEYDVAWMPRFGAWQPLLQPYFPEWRENLEFEEPEPKEGTFVFMVSLGDGKVRRRIAMPSDATLDDLATWVRESVNFDDDHLYQFTFRDPTGSDVRVSDARLDDGEIPADLVPIGRLPLEPGQTMDMLYDFGDNWEFTIKLERIEPPGAKIKAPRILEKTGRAPEQYPRWDD